LITLVVILHFLLPLFFAGLYFYGYLYSVVDLANPYNLSILTGAIAYVIFMGQFLLAARIRILERWVPQDKLMALHGSAGAASFALILIHAILKFITTTRFEALTLQTALGIFALILTLFLSPAAYLILQGRKKGNYLKTLKAHNLFALAGVAVTLHVFMAASTWSLPLQSFTLIWGLGNLSLYVNHKIIRPRKAARIKLLSVDKIAPEFHRYTFDREITRKSGQFAYFRFEENLPGQPPEYHPFTISSPAGTPVEIVVGSLGDYSETMPDLTPGIEVKFDGPYGHFRPRKLPQGTPIVFLTAGIGITPALSLARDKELKTHYPMKVIWSVRSPETSDSIAPLIDNLEIIYTRKAPAGAKVGKLNKETLAGISLPNKADITEVVWFICGPKGFLNSMRQSLKNLGVPVKHIKEERFSW